MERSRTVKNICLVFFILILFVIISPWEGLAADRIVVNYTNKTTQKFKMSRNASMIRRIMFDDERSGDRIVVTYHDDTHQVFTLKASIAKIKRLYFESSDSAPSASMRPSAKPVPPPQSPSASADFAIAPDGPRLGSIWTVTETCGGERWTGIWTRRGGSALFDAIWKSSRGRNRRTTVEISEISDGMVKLYREDAHGYYEGEFSSDGKRVINGWASWYEPNCQSWYAVIR